MELYSSTSIESHLSVQNFIALDKENKTMLSTLKVFLSKHLNHTPIFPFVNNSPFLYI